MKYRVFIRGGKEVVTVQGSAYSIGEHDGVLKIYGPEREGSIPAMSPMPPVIHMFKDWEQVAITDT